MKNSIYFQMVAKRESIVSVTKNLNKSVASQNVILPNTLSARTFAIFHDHLLVTCYFDTFDRIPGRVFILLKTICHK